MTLLDFGLSEFSLDLPMARSKNKNGHKGARKAQTRRQLLRRRLRNAISCESRVCEAAVDVGHHVLANGTLKLARRVRGKTNVLLLIASQWKPKVCVVTDAVPVASASSSSSSSSSSSQNMKVDVATMTDGSSDNALARPRESRFELFFWTNCCGKCRYKAAFFGF